jgi:hypothetical protein
MTQPQCSVHHSQYQQQIALQLVTDIHCTVLHRYTRAVTTGAAYIAVKVYM